MIEQPPFLDQRCVQRAMLMTSRADVMALVNDINEDYLYWSEAKYKKMPTGITSKELWAIVKATRRAQTALLYPKYGIQIPVTNRMQRLCHYFDMNFGGSWGNDSFLPLEDRERFLISSLMEEAISSSQMEGAATTRKVAKDMLRKNITPRSRSEQMIANNYSSIRFITEHKNEELTPELLRHIHALMTRKTLDDAMEEGHFRTNDDVVVENSITHEVVHTPPTYTEIPVAIQSLCDFVNNDDGVAFIHPIIKAVVLHFMIAYIHPFVDGNGRTARAMFYWYMLKKGYWLTEYLSISRIIYKSKASYEKAYQYAEADECDMGYFLTYHLRVLELAFKELKTYIEKKILQKQRNIDILHISGLNDRQSTIVAWLRENRNMVLTVKELETRFGVSHPTAKQDMDGLVERGFVTKIPVNKVKFNYFRSDNFDELITRK